MTDEEQRIAFYRRASQLSENLYFANLQELESAVQELAQSAIGDAQLHAAAKILQTRYRLDAQRRAKEIRFHQERLRRETERGEKQPCFVCQQHRQIAHLHHIVSIKTMAQILFENRSLKQLPMVTVWLCPNHHAWWHWLEEHKKRGGSLLDTELPFDDIDKFQELHRFARRHFWKPVEDAIAQASKY